ncbi:chemotaxis protein CheA [Lichenifustis flavocetrariae]|uniref:Chemotaxis protein CheA n=1 Tax=Lichenifustis flavocetrariae TaxID=2949735 RepID=A0AA41YSB0_9HYPH|nr:chemotaxis protein CheA [Lichenifustis flavocetrariae]MCW6507641.1 chemotaxis protein CheA [Lichenifustis flavocetrariae]
MIDLDAAAIYRQEAGELLDSLEGSLLDLGQTPADRTLVDQAFRALHTIKGSGAMFGFDQVAAFTHDFETAFDLVRRGTVPVTQDLVSLALAAKDHIRSLIETPDEADATVGRTILANLQILVARPGSIAEPPVEAAIAPDAGSSETAGAGWRMTIAFAPEVLRNGTDPLALLDELRGLGPCTVVALTDSVPDLGALEPQDLHLQWSVTLRGDCPREAIDDVFMFVLDDMKLDLTPLGVEPSGETVAAAAPELVIAESTPLPVASTPATPPEPQKARTADKVEPPRRADDKVSTSVRVQAERLDELMDRVGELVIAQARLSQLAHTRNDGGIQAIAEEIERLASGLRDTTMGIRMVPIGSLFARFRRLIHDLSRDLGKPVEFVTSGEDTELDKTMIERLADPLVHLIRNAIDHGIENPERRAKAGKPPVGRIELLAQHVGAQVMVTVRDDGGGLDTTRIRAKAEEQGLIVPGTTLSDAEVHQFLFHPGFSTAQTVSALSGRGVGMDVVKRTIEALRGSIDVSTELGHGSAMSLRLPLTLAIIEGLLIRVGDSRYIVPLSMIEECVELPADQARGRNFLNIRGGLVPFLRLRDLFDAPGEPDAHQKIIITSVGDARVGLVADQIIGSHQTVIKSLSKLQSDATMFSGATILGDGSAALILDVAQLVAIGQLKAETETMTRAA